MSITNHLIVVAHTKLYKQIISRFSTDPQSIKKQNQASKMALWVKGIAVNLASQVQSPNPHSRRRKQTLTSCPLTYTHAT